MEEDNKLPPGFESPIAVPEGEDKASRWQVQNRSWWEKNPMRYDWNEKVNLAEFSRPFYEEIDRRFFSDAARYTPPQKRSFDELIPFEQLGNWDVLEIGVGNGSHAQLLAPHCKSYTGIDLTSYAVESTRRRFELFELEGRIEQMDAEAMSFQEDFFDYIWSWGVIHHSANTGNVLREMYRVLRPGGCVTVMVYHRSFLYTWIAAGLLRGILCGEFFKGYSLHDIVQRHTDGAIARFYRPDEWMALVESCGFLVKNEWIKGQKSEVVLLPAGRFKRILMSIVPNWFSRFVLNRCRQGSFLITELQKPVGV